MKPRQKKPPRLSRKLLLQLVTDLVERLQNHAAVAEAIQASATPHDGETVTVWRRCKTLELALDHHAGRARDAAGFAEIIRDRMAQGGAK